jgi:hypothetical protein
MKRGLLTILLEEVGAEIDSNTLPKLYDLASIDVDATLEDFRRRGWTYCEPRLNRRPSKDLLLPHSEALIRSSARRALYRGGIGSAAGPLGAISHRTAHFVQSLRMIQRLGLLYGYDPHNETEKAILLRALARGYDVKLPAQNKMQLRLREVPNLVRTINSQAHSSIMSTILESTKSGGLKRLRRWIPGAGIGFEALAAKKNMYRIGENANGYFTRLYQGDIDLSDMVEAIEIHEIGGT